MPLAGSAVRGRVPGGSRRKLFPAVPSRAPKFLGAPTWPKPPFVLKVRNRGPAVGEFRCPAPDGSPDVRVCTAEPGF